MRETEDRFLRWGPLSLVIAKFVPGFATVAPPLAGATRVKLAPFLGYSAISAALWSGLAAGLGMMFARQIDWLLEQLKDMGAYAVMVVGVALALFIAFKWWQRWRFFKALRMARISVDDLYRMMQEGQEPLVVDVRSEGARSLDPRHIPGAVTIDIDKLDEMLPLLPAQRDIILYCT